MSQVESIEVTATRQRAKPSMGWPDNLVGEMVVVGAVVAYPLVVLAFVLPQTGSTLGWIELKVACALGCLVSLLLLANRRVRHEARTGGTDLVHDKVAMAYAILGIACMMACTAWGWTYSMSGVDFRIAGV